MKHVGIALPLVALLLTCGRQSTEESGKTVLSPAILWKAGSRAVYPDEVDSVRITVASAELTTDLVMTFPFDAGEGVFEALPSGVTVTATVEGIDSSGVAVYRGSIGPVRISGDVYEMVIEAHQVTPIAPSHLTAYKLRHDRVHVQWRSNSTNEDKFVILRSDSLDTGYAVVKALLDTVYTDTGLWPAATYRYRVFAQNAAGTSDTTHVVNATTDSIDTVGPVITVLSHTNPDTVSAPVVQLTGRVRDDNGISALLVESRDVDVDDRGEWEVRIEVDSLVELEAVDAGSLRNRRVDTLVLVYDPAFIDTANKAPQFAISSEDLAATIKVGSVYSSVLSATDTDSGDTLEFSVVGGPTVRDDTVAWTPERADTGNNAVTAYVRDQDGARDSLSWILSVVDTAQGTPNTAPRFSTRAVDMLDTAYAGALYRDTVVATDIEDTGLTYGKVSGPATLTVDAAEGTIVWSPSDTGVVSVTVKAVDDSGAAATLTWAITVVDSATPVPNSLPEFTTNPDSLLDSATVGEEYAITVSATDAEDDALSYSVVTGPEGLVVGSVSGEVRWTPVDTGVSIATVGATDDSGGTVELTWAVTVCDTNHPPAFLSTGSDMNAHATVGSEYRDTVHATDADGDQLSFGIVESPAGMRLNDSAIAWTPTHSGVGSDSVSVRVSDGNGGADTLGWVVVAAVSESALVAWYAFDGTATDSGPHGNHGMAQNGTGLSADRHGVVGRSFHFDGVDDRVYVGDPPNGSLDMNLGQGFTICAWVKLDTLKDYAQMVLRKKQKVGGTNDEGYALDVNRATDGAQVVFKVEGTDTKHSVIIGSTSLIPDSWYFATAIRDAGSQELRLYLNGVQDAEPVADSLSATMETDADLYIGYNEPYDKGLAGSLDEVRIYKRVLSEEEIRSLYEE